MNTIENNTNNTATTSSSNFITCKAHFNAHKGPISCVRFNRDGNYALTAANDKLLRLWNPHKQLELKTYRGHSYRVLDAALFPDNARFVSCGGDRQGPFLWDVTTGEVTRRWNGHKSQINTVTVGCRCGIVVSGGYDRCVHVWDVRSRSSRPVQSFTDAADSITSVAVTSSSDAQANINPSKTHEETTDSNSTRSSSSSLSLSSLPDSIISTSVDGGIRIYDVRAGRLRTVRLPSPVTRLSRSRLQPQSFVVAALDSAVRLVDISVEGFVDTHHQHQHQHQHHHHHQQAQVLGVYRGAHINTAYPVDAVLSHDESHVAVGSEDGSLAVYDVLQQRAVGVVDRAHNGHTVAALSHHPGHSVLLSGSHGGDMCLWEYSPK